MTNLNLPPLGLQDVLPRGEKLAKYYILEATYYLHVYQNPNLAKNLIDRVIELSQHLNVSFQGSSTEALAYLIKETLRKLIILLKSASLTNEFYNAVRILYNRSINLKVHQLAHVLASGAEQMWKIIGTKDNKNNALSALYGTNLGECSVSIKEKQKNDIEIVEYLDKILVPNIQKFISSNSDIIKALERVDIKDITLDNIYEAYISCSGHTGSQPSVSVDKISDYIANIMSGYFNVVNVLGFRLLIRLVHAVGVREFVKMAKVSYDVGRFFFREQEEYQRFRQDVREANRQLRRGIAGLAGGIISPFYSAIKSHPLGRLLASMGEFGYRQLYLRTGRLFGLGYRHSDYRSYYESRTPSPFDSEEAWASFGSKTKTDIRLEYEKSKRIKLLQDFLASKNPKYKDENEVMKLLNNETLVDKARDYWLLKNKRNLSTEEENRLNRAISYISKITGLRDEKDIDTFVSLYTRYRDVSGILSERTLSRTTLHYEPAPITGTTSLPSIEQIPSPTSDTGTTQTTDKAQVSDSNQISSTSESLETESTPGEDTSKQEALKEELVRHFNEAIQKSLETGSTPGEDTSKQEALKEELVRRFNEVIQKINESANGLPIQLTTDFSSSLLKVIDRIESMEEKREEAGAEVTEKDLKMLQKEVENELTSNICDIIKCVQRTSTQGHITSEELKQLKPIIESIAEDLAKHMYGDVSRSRRVKGDSHAKEAHESTTEGAKPQSNQVVTKSKKPSPTQQFHTTHTKSASQNVQQASVTGSATLPPTTPHTPTTASAASTGSTQHVGKSVGQKSSSATIGGQSKGVSKLRKPKFRSRWLAYGKKLIRSFVPGRAASAASAAGGVSGLEATLGARALAGGALRGLLGGGRMLTMLANPLGIGLGAGLLGLAGYGGYKILTKAILPQLRGEGFSFAEAKRQETIDKVIEQMSGQDLSGRFEKIQPTRVSLVGSGSRSLPKLIRARNAAEIRLTSAPAALTGLEIKDINTNAPAVFSTTTTPIPTGTNTSEQSTVREVKEQTEEEKTKQNNVTRLMQSSSFSGEAQEAAHQYNQQVIHQAHVALNEQLISAINKQAEAIKIINEKLNEIIASQNSKEPSIVGP
jgi:ribosomal protein L12E/L44/L45/RPP1/RPP2/isopentenyl phosphate kinase